MHERPRFGPEVVMSTRESLVLALFEEQQVAAEESDRRVMCAEARRLRYLALSSAGLGALPPGAESTHGGPLEAAVPVEGALQRGL